jgi:hypothetical protein
MMPYQIGTSATDPDAAGERIVAFALPGKHPEAPFWRSIKPPFATQNTPDLRGHATVSKAGWGRKEAPLLARILVAKPHSTSDQVPGTGFLWKVRWSN